MNTLNSSVQASTGIVNVLVHGLIFMRLSPGQTFLELVIPKLIETSTTPHQFLGGVRGNLNQLNGVVEWRDKGFIGDVAPRIGAKEMPSTLTKSVLKLSMTSTNLGGWNNANEAGKIMIQWPKRISSLRCDYFDRVFLYDTAHANIGDEIKSRCRGTNINAKTGIVTCLEYQYDTAAGVTIPNWSPGMNVHCYFEPLMKHSITEVNEDLGQAASLFQDPTKFDLQMRKDADGVFTAPGETCPNSAAGINTGDDLSLGESLGAHSSGVPVPMENISPANCPNFFVGP
jgi:hypothetical protein